MLTQQHPIHLDFGAGSLLAPAGGQRGVSSCGRAGGRQAQGLQRAAAQPSRLPWCGCLGLLLAIPACLVSIELFKGMEIKLYLGQGRILSKNTCYVSSISCRGSLSAAARMAVHILTALNVLLDNIKKSDFRLGINEVHSLSQPR